MEVWHEVHRILKHQTKKALNSLIRANYTLGKLEDLKTSSFACPPSIGQTFHNSNNLTSNLRNDWVCDQLANQNPYLFSSLLS